VNIKISANPILVFSLFILGGLILLVSYYDFPIVRNSIIYAATIQGISEYNIWQAADFAQNKPLGFAILSWPFNEIWGVNAGLKISSWLWTGLFGLASILFIKYLANVSFSADAPLSADGFLSADGSFPADGSLKTAKQQQLNTAIIISLFNPLLFYQFISAYPDTLFATLFLAAILSFERVLAKNGHVFFSFLAFVLVFACIWVKHHGYVLIPIFLVMSFYCRTAIQEQWQLQNKRLKFTIICFLLLLALLNDAQQGELALFNVTHNSSNFLAGEHRLTIVITNMENFLVFILLTFSLLSPILLYWPAYKQRTYFLIPILLLFILPILYYKGAQYNIRYFIAIIPILAWIIAGNMQQWPNAFRHLALTLFIFFNTFSTFYYNHVDFYHWTQGKIQLPVLDNLRLIPEQYQERQHLALIQQHAETHANTLLYFSDYYKQGTFGVWQKAGLLPPDLKTHYIMHWQTKFLEQNAIQKALVYEYIGIGTAMNPLPNDPKFSPYLKKLTKQLYLFDLNNKL